MTQKLTGEARRQKLRRMVLLDSLVVLVLGILLWSNLALVWVTTTPIIDSTKYPMLREFVIIAGLVEGIIITAGLVALYMHLSKNRERLYVDIVGEES